MLASLRGDTDAALAHVGEAFEAVRERIAKIFSGFSNFQAAWANFKSGWGNMLARVWLILDAVKNLRNGVIKLYEDGSGALLDLATAFGFPEEAAQELLAKVWLIIERFQELFQAIRQ